MVEDRKGLSLNKGFKERKSLAKDVGHRQDEVSTYEREQKITDPAERKRHTNREIFHEMDKEETSAWNINKQDAEDTEQLDTESTYTESQAEKPDNILPSKEHGLGTVDCSSVSPPLNEDVILTSKQDIKTSPEISRSTRQKVCPLDTKVTSKQVKKTPPEMKPEKADVTSHYRGQRELHHEETKEKTSTATSKKLTVPKKTEEPKEVSLFNQAEAVSHTDALSSPPKQDLPQVFSHPGTDISTEKDLKPSKKMVSWDKITKSAKYNVPLKKTTSEVEGMYFKEEQVLAASGEVSPPVSVRAPSLWQKTVSCDEVSLPEETVLCTKNTLTCPKAVIPHEDVTAVTKLIPKDETVPTLPSKTPTSLAQKVITPQVNFSQEARTVTTEHPPTTEHKKGTQEFEQQTPRKGILLFSGRTGSTSIIKSSPLSVSVFDNTNLYISVQSVIFTT